MRKLIVLVIMWAIWYALFHVSLQMLGQGLLWTLLCGISLALIAVWILPISIQVFTIMEKRHGI